MTHLLVIGGSDAGIEAGLRAREVDPASEVTLLVADRYPNFSICGIPYHLSGEVADWRDLAHSRIEGPASRPDRRPRKRSWSIC
jgi:NADPH-dependent 2,4-dienoyl-CoA reductase/sulfur reductase-like enzyme